MENKNVNEVNESELTTDNNKVNSVGEVMLTTFDNPYNPFEQFVEWFLFDTEMGYYSCNYLGRIVKLEDDMTQKEVDEEIERAIDEIILYNPLNIYKKVKR